MYMMNAWGGVLFYTTCQFTLHYIYLMSMYFVTQVKHIAVFTGKHCYSCYLTQPLPDKNAKEARNTKDRFD